MSAGDNVLFAAALAAAACLFEGIDRVTHLVESLAMTALNIGLLLLALL